MTTVNYSKFAVSVAKAVGTCEAALAKANNTLLGKLKPLCKELGKLNEAQYKAQLSKPMREAYVATRRYTSPESLKVALSEVKTAVLGLCNGVAALDGENLSAYCRRARPELDKLGVRPARVKSVKKGAGKIASKKTIKTGKDARKHAAMTLAGGDMARADIILYFTDPNKIAERFNLLVEMFVKMNPVK